MHITSNRSVTMTPRERREAQQRDRENAELLSAVRYMFTRTAIGKFVIALIVAIVLYPVAALIWGILA